MWALGRRDRIPTNPIEALSANMVRVRGGTFTMVCTRDQGGDCYGDEKPSHQVTVSDYYIGKYEVTQKEWRAVMGSDPPELRFKGCDNCPVEQVSWEDIQQFLTKLNAKTGKVYRLPTEAEWEYAARGGSSGRGYKYSGSNNLDKVAWYRSNSRDKTHPVGRKKANELGLYDMSGNVGEWCSDDWHGNYTGAPTDGRAWIDSPRASNRVNRGGSWVDFSLFCRVSFRFYGAPSSRLSNLGFRLAL
jgi:formylglycine-generating enzyme required for sulfatase activity